MTVTWWQQLTGFAASQKALDKPADVVIKSDAAFLHVVFVESRLCVVVRAMRLTSSDCFKIGFEVVVWKEKGSEI